MVREMDEILRQQIAQPANSCNSENGVSFLDQVITPLYEVVAAVGVIIVLVCQYLLHFLPTPSYYNESHNQVSILFLLSGCQSCHHAGLPF